MEGKEENILDYDQRLKEFEGTLILGGLKTTQNIKRVLKNHKGTLFVKAILQEIPEHQFSYQSFLWSTDRVSLLPNSWKNQLSQLCGVYLLVSGDGKQYVGSASSKEGGFLSSWRNYEKNGHGDNKELKKIPSEKRIYSVAILETAPSSYTNKQVVELENNWKKKLGSRAFGLNSN